MTGRFAPSPTGPLHFGSLVAAVGSWLSARRAGGRWLVRIEDLDTARVVPGSDDEILRALERYALRWDGEPVWQSRRQERYAAALEALRARGLAFDCGCTRADLQRAASAPAKGDPVDAAVYPGTCRDGLPEGKLARATRFRVPGRRIHFDDAVLGSLEEDLARETGDFVIKRADGPFAYQLAVVVDDAEQGVTEVVRGGDLAGSTPRQIALLEALGHPVPRYAHLPLVIGPDGAKLGKRTAALPLPSLDADRVSATLARALEVLGVAGVALDRPEAMVEEALGRFDLARVPKGSVTI